MIVLNRPPEHCLGIYADVATSGTVRAGDLAEALVVLDPIDDQRDDLQDAEPPGAADGGGSPGAPSITGERQATPAG